MKKPNKKENGFIALVSVIILSFILTIVVFTLSFSGFSSRFNILNSEFKEISFFGASSCRDIAFLKLSVNDSYLPAPEGDVVFLSDSEDGLSCEIVSVQEGEGKTTIETTSQFEKAKTNLMTVAERTGDNLSVISSYEVENF